MTSADFRPAVTDVGPGKPADVAAGRLTRAYSDLLVVFPSSVALLLAAAGFGVVGWAPVMDGLVPGWQVRVL